MELKNARGEMKAYKSFEGIKPDHCISVFTEKITPPGINL